MNEQAVSTTIVRYYVEGGVAKVEAVVWRWVPGDPNGSDERGGSPVDPGLAARARPLPSQYDPGMVPNRWVWVGANDAAAKFPRPSETVRGEVSKPDGSVQETVDHVHAADGEYWDFYRLPLRAGIELIDEDAWKALKTEAEAAEVQVKQARAELVSQQLAAREVHRAAARKKLAALGLTDDEVSAIVGGS